MNNTSLKTPYFINKHRTGYLHSTVHGEFRRAELLYYIKQLHLSYHEYLILICARTSRSYALKNCSPTGCPGRYYPPAEKLAPYLAKRLNGGASSSGGSSRGTQGKTPILAKAKASLSAMEAYLKKNSPNYERFKELPKLYVEEAEREGVAADIAFAQAVLETGHFKFGGDVSISQNNFSGIGAVGGGAKGASFPDLRTSVRAQIQHLLAYADTRAPKTSFVDPRFSLVK